VTIADERVSSARATRPRIGSLDIVRGAVMVLMAIDHVRVYSGVPAGGPGAGIFFTRWVTHFCAPAFVFFAGTAAFLHGQRLGDRRALSRYLAIRGLILVGLELTVIHLSWTFSLASMTAQLAGVIWMIGWCMVLLAAIVHLPMRAIAVLGLAVIAAQDVLRLLPPAVVDTAPWLWQFLYFGGEVHVAGAVTFNVLYSIVPWIGVMAAGYAFGAIMVREPAARRRLCLAIGLGATALFLVAGGLAVWRGPAPEDGPPALFRLLNQRKYPASQLFLLMTLGPSIALLAWADGARSGFARVLETFGRVPLFYYLLHIPFIHLVALGVWYARDGEFGADRFASAPYVFVENSAGWWSLPLLYAVFAGVVAVLYFACRWYAAFKARRRGGSVSHPFAVPAIRYTPGAGDTA
jgi:uncharacterized membrane protein